MTASGPADQSITGLLDYGSKTLVYFETFEPLYMRAFPDMVAVASYQELHARYYEQNGMNEAALVDAFEAVSAAANTMADEHGTQQTISQNISQAWQGAAASTALEKINTQLTLASADAEVAKSIASALELAPDALRAAVKLKSDAVAGILDNGEARVDGKSKDDVEAIIAGAEGVGLSNMFGDDTLVNKIRRIFPDMDEGIVDGFNAATNSLLGGLVIGGTPYANLIEKRCKDWLDSTFKREYAEKADLLADACDGTDRGVTDAYKAITDAMGKLETASYPRPKGTSTQNNPTGDDPGSSNPSSDTPAGDTPSSTDTPTTPASTPSSNPTSTDTDDDDDSTDPAGTSNPLSGLTNLSQIAGQLSPLLSSLTESVQSALTSLTTTIDTEIDKALENLKNLTSAEDDPAEETGEDKDGDGKPDEESTPLAEFDLAGKEVTFEQGEDGLKMVVTSPDGTTTEYRMTIDENGVPLISAVEGETGEPAGEDQGEEETPAEGTPASEEQPAGQGSVPSAPAPIEQEEDGEYTPQPIPAPEFTEDETEPEAPVPAPAEPLSDQPPVGDTGALLAEAGPL
ncbi:hypothetical protein [Nocardia shimofusensis]|uniref:hypothetical protein n=1 Tax=Nocardia shimofusensis TaxID=228596 RepID=UPI000AA59815|nr:hypothetical protein [Nocardia shimofusensis]